MVYELLFLAQREKTMTKMTLTQALAEIKLLEKRIQSGISEMHPFAQLINDKLTLSRNTLSMTKDEFAKNANANFQSVLSLMDRREKIKFALIKKNAETVLTILNRTVTIAEAIEMKKSIALKKVLHSYLTSDLASLLNNANKINRDLETEADKAIISMFGSSSEDRKTEQAIAFREQFIRQRSVTIFDPTEAQSYITSLEKEINDFELSIDTQLSIANATTFIEIE